MNRIQEFLQNNDCRFCEFGAMQLVSDTPDSNGLWHWKCQRCGKTGNIGYDLRELTHIDLSPDKEEELMSGKVENFHEFIEKWGIPRPKVRILIDQNPCEY